MNGARVAYSDDHENRSDVIDHLLRRPEWHARAACKGQLDVMFPRTRGAGEAWAEARAVCMRCPVRVECCAEADARGETFGMWGGKRRQPLTTQVDFGWLLAQREWTAVELGDATNTHPQTVRRWLRAAVNKGLVTERVDPHNRARRLYRAAEERRTA